MTPPAHWPKTTLWLFVLLCGLEGCQTAPAVRENPFPPAPPTIRLCGRDVPAEEAAVRTEVLLHVPPRRAGGDARRTRLEEFGFHCRYAGVLDKKPASYHPARTLPELVIGLNAHRDKMFHSLVCTCSLTEIGRWGQHFFPIRVVLPYDEEGRITEVEVDQVRARPSRYAGFFAHRPDLREPIGLPIEQAQALMEAQKFQCAYASPADKGGDRRLHLDCTAYDETPLGGNIVRVQLFYDDARNVSEAEVVQTPGAFDDLRCMLPHSGDTLVGGAVKVVVFPLRLYAALVVAGLLADAAMGRP